MPRRAPVIQPYPGHRNAERVRLTARVFRHGPAPTSYGGGRARLAALWSIWGTHEWPGAPVSIAGPGFRGEAEADAEGFVRFDLACDRPLPAHAVWDRARLWMPDRPEVPVARAHILSPGRDGRLAVLSDVDDTVIETGRIGPRNWRRLVLQGPAERRPVAGAQALFDALSARAPSAATAHGDWPARLGPDPGEREADGPTRPFFYVSSSPWNLQGYLAEFLRLNGFPAGVFALRDWGADRATFGKSSHGAHKSERVAELLAFHPELSFVLIGDDSQGDVAAYARAVTDHPDRVAAVFIRSTGPANLSSEGDRAVADIRATHTPVYVGANWGAGLAMVAELGLGLGPLPTLSPSAAQPS